MPRKYGRIRPERPSTRPKKRKFTSNQFTAKADTEFVSTSASKLESVAYDDIKLGNTSNYVICHFLLVLNFLSEVLVCKSCGKDINFTRKHDPGIAFKLVITCDCQTREVHSSPYVSHCYEVNRRFIFVMRVLGLGYNILKVFLSFMDITHTISYTMYYSFLTNILTAAKSLFEVIQKKAVGEEIGMNTAVGNSPLHLSVSGDGSWKKRGFSSLFGITTLIGKYSSRYIYQIILSTILR